MKIHAVTAGAIGLALAAVLMSGCARPTGGRVRVVATTTLISTIINEVAPDRFAVTTIAPAGLCPGHFDLRPSDVNAANQAQLLLNHGWEAWFPDLEKGIAPPGPRKVTLKTQGNWMVPDLQKQATDELAALLAEVDAPHADSFKARAIRYKARVDSAAATIKARFAADSLPAVIASDKQAPFLVWLGFPVVATYGRAEDFTARELTRLARVALDKQVKLVVDNLQSGPETGLEFAKSVGAGHVTLTNFPSDAGYAAAVTANADSLLAHLQ
jgi:zinc transport system substrate-binding protein